MPLFPKKVVLFKFFSKEMECETFKQDFSNKVIVLNRNRVGLLDVRPGFEPQARQQNKIRKVFLRRFPPNRFLAKTLRVNKNCHEKFFKKSPLMYKINTHNISGVRN